MKIDLSIVIPERFKEKLSERFNLKNAEWKREKFRITAYCPLCQEFMHRTKQMCEYCLFNKFQGEDIVTLGCWEWIKSVLGEYPVFYATLYDVNWNKDRDEKAREQIKLLCKEAEALITWEGRKINEIVKEVYKDWKNPFYGAVPYMEAMLSLESINDKYGCDDAESIVLYFLSNVQTWRGEIARRIKQELKQLIKDAKIEKKLKDANKYSGGMKW